MLDNLKSIKIKGGFFETEATIDLFNNVQDRISFIYGRNGSGKTSISNAFESLKNNTNSEFENIILQDFDSNDIILQDDEKNRIYVFSEKFIDEKVKFSNDGMNTIVMFGEQIEIEEELESKKKELEDLKKKYEEAKKSDDEYNDEKNNKSPFYYKNLIINNLKSDTGWAAREQKLKQSTRKSSVSESTVEAIIMTPYKRDVKDDIKKLDDFTQFLITAQSNSMKYPLLSFDYSLKDNYSKNLKQLLNKKIEKPELTDREKLIFDLMRKGNQSNVESAQEYFESDVDYCPYCFQNISSDYREKLLNEFKTVLNDNVSSHIKEIEEYIIPLVDLDLYPYLNLNNKLCNDINNTVVTINKHIENINNLISEKKNNIYVPISDANIKIEQLLNKLTEFVNQLSKEILDFNNKVDNKKKTELECQELNKIISRNEIDSLLKSYNDALKKRDTNSKCISELIKQGNQIKKIINDLNSKKLNFNIALNKINKDLSYIFFSKDRLSVRYEDDKYVVLSYGNKVDLNKLSIGERNAIALCYFFAQVLENTSETNEYSNDFFLLIDDPISSFDFENKVGVYSFIRSKLSKILSNNINNKLIIFTHEIEAMNHFQKYANEFKDFSFTYLTLYNKQTKKLDKFDKNGYTQAFISTYNYVMNPTDEEDLIIGNSMRKVIEAFSTFQCKQDIESFMRDEDILSIIPDNLKSYFENFMYRLVLNGESHFAEQSISYPEGNFYELISRNEKQITAKNLISFLYIINPVHVKKQLGGNKTYISNVESWVEELKATNSN